MSNKLDTLLHNISHVNEVCITDSPHNERLTISIEISRFYPSNRVSSIPAKRHMFLITQWICKWHRSLIN